MFIIRQWIFFTGNLKAQNIIKINYLEFPGGLVVRFQPFHCHDPGSIPVKELRSQNGQLGPKNNQLQFQIPFCSSVFLTTEHMSLYSYSLTPFHLSGLALYLMAVCLFRSL